MRLEDFAALAAEHGHLEALGAAARELAAKLRALVAGMGADAALPGLSGGHGALNLTDLGILASELAWDAVLSCFQGAGPRDAR
jgi:hypothetical protein